MRESGSNLRTASKVRFAASSPGQRARRIELGQNPVFRDIQERILRVGCSKITEIPIQGAMMRIPFLRIAKILVCTLTTIPVFAQDLPSIPPAHDPSVWARPNEPYALTLTETVIGVNASNTPQTHISQLKLYRDSVGRERTEASYDNGRLATVTIRDPGRNSTTFLKVVEKSAFVLYTPRPLPPPPGKGWSVERLQPRVIAGFPAEGFRFTRTIPAAIDGTVPSVTVTEEDWISNELGVVLEQTSDNPRIGKTTKTVTRLQRVEPDSALFVIPSEYSVQQSGPPAP
jgi:hypothetical protein